jgi:hypothetical protein
MGTVVYMSTYSVYEVPVSGTMDTAALYHKKAKPVPGSAIASKARTMRIMAPVQCAITGGRFLGNADNWIEAAAL